MKHLFRLFIFLSFIHPATSLAAKSTDKLTYKKYPMIRHGQKFIFPPKIKVAGEDLKIKIHPKMGTHILLGIDQLYVSKNLKKKVLIKQDVGLSSNEVIGQWTKLNSGSVFHYIKNKKVIAIYAEGYHERALHEIERQFVSLKARKVGQSNLSPFLQVLFTCAYAEVGASGWSENFDWQGTETPAPVGAVDNAPAVPSTEVGSPGESLSRCLLRQTGASLGDMGQSAVDTVSGAASAVWNDPMGAARATGNYLYGVGESAVTGVYNAGSAAVSYCWENCLDVDQMWSDAGDAVDSMYQLGEQLVSRVSSAVEGFQNLAPAVRNRLICEMGGQMIAEFGVGAVLSFLGGSALAAPRIALMLNNLEEKIGRGMAALSALGQSNIPVDAQQDYVSDFMRGNMSEAEIIAVINGTPGNSNIGPRMAAALEDPNARDDELPLQSAASVDPTIDGNLMPATAAAAGARSLETIEDMYVNQQISVTSLSGNTYSGEFVEFVQDARVNEMTMVLRMPDGQLESYRVSRLDLNSISGPQNNFSLGRQNVIRPIAGTELGAEIQGFQARTGLSLTAGQGDNFGSNGFHIDYEAGTVTLDQSVLNDPARMSNLMRTSLPQAIRAERQARSNLRDNHGVTVAPGGVLQAADPTSNLGRMVAGLERRGVAIRIVDPNISSTGALGLATGSRAISINSSLLQPGRETDLMSVLRHEIRHSTTVSGSVRYPMVDPARPLSPPSSTALAYAGRNIQLSAASDADARLLSGAGVSELYTRSFRADEYDARLTQSPRNNPYGTYQRGNARDDSQIFFQRQGEMLAEVIRGNLSPVAVRYYSDTTLVSYRVQHNGANVIIDIPIQGPIDNDSHAARLARQVVDSRIDYLRSQYRSRVRENTFTPITPVRNQ